tara:strand:- start:25 stop:456 length:432 start_codon:yes stop_codon:yes gene_type:complete
MINKKYFCGIAVFVIVGILMFSFFPLKKQDMVIEREKFLDLKYEIQKSLLKQGKYRCCLEKPCIYCIEKTPGHGEGAECSCLDDVVNGVHPCGECIGEILEGHGNPLLSEYFAKAIAEKTGEEDAIKKIIEEKYGISIENQLI